LSYQTDEQILERFFSQCGTVKAVRMALLENGLKKGYAHIEFSTHEEAAKAKELNGEMLDGRSLKVDISEKLKKSRTKANWN